MSRQLLDPRAPDGPIPGENKTSDERNFPWRRPPDIVDTDEAVEYISEQLTDTQEGFMYMNLLKSEVTIAACVDMVVTKGISEGKWTPDFALLIAGPIARLFEIMAKSYNITYEIGIDEAPEYVSAEVVDKRLSRGTPPEAIDEEEIEALRLEQEEMLGRADQEDVPAFNTGGLMAPSPMTPSVYNQPDPSFDFSGAGDGIAMGAKLGKAISDNEKEAMEAEQAEIDALAALEETTGE